VSRWSRGYSDIILADNSVFAIRPWLTGTLAGRALLIGLVLKGATLTLAAFGASLTGVLGALDSIGGASLLAAALVLGYQALATGQRRLLWRVRRKLTLSYVFIGFVPALLLISFFVLSGVVLFFNISAYLMQSRVRSLVDEVRLLADTTAHELERAPEAAALADALDQRATGAYARYPETSYAIVPVERSCSGNTGRATAVAPASPRAVGPWAFPHGPPSLPDWIGCGGHAGLVAYAAPGSGADASVPGLAGLAVRAVAMPAVASVRYAVIVDVPLTTEIARRLYADTGVEMGEVAALIGDGRRIDLVADDLIERAVDPGPRQPVAAATGGDAGGSFGDVILRRPFDWVIFFDYTDWDTGRGGTATLAIRTSIAGIYTRLSGTPFTQIGDFNFGQVLLILLGVVAGAFLVIQIVAIGMGLGLARSITGSVHELFAGTERVRQGDLQHRIAVRSRDQLGELADSFNSMTASIEDLLQEKAEKERLEQELRIARAIQMSLLPQGPLGMPGLALLAHCEPAREVGGDYYDVLPIDGRRLGVLIADVAGKGTSAALYMAELKGVILALSQRHCSPRQLLIDANRILFRHLDPRSFITITYAVVDLEAGIITHARAGHCPLIYRPGPAHSDRRAQVLAPDGLALGLQIDQGEKFDSLLEEVTVPIGSGDLFVLYTDGISEAMNASGDYLGDARLGSLIEELGDLPFAELRERILHEIGAFVGSAPQQDDMTMVLVKVGDNAEG
jgi:serine phosphatase RsbU (regulator of sigma subunit)